MQTARRRLVVLLAIFIGAALGTLLGALALVLVNPAAPALLEQKSISIREGLVEVLPHSAEPEFVSTAPAAPSASPTPTVSISTLVPTPGALATRTAASKSTPTTRPIPQVGINPIQSAVTLQGIKHEYQRWNNCGPTTLEMNLSYFGRTDTQAEIAAFTKPDPDDRDVRPDELAAYVAHAGLHSITRVNGTVDRLKLLLSNGIPVIVETGLVKQPEGWMGHYRLVTGYDARQFVTMDSYDGPSVKIAFDDLDATWREFNRVYLIVYSDAQDARVRAMLADTLDDGRMYTQAAQRARDEIESNSKDAFGAFNLGMSLNGLKHYPEAAAAFDQARVLGLPWRMLWYQFGPYEAYLQTGRYTETIQLADSLLGPTDNLEESHYYKGLALRALGRTGDARSEFQTALRYNKNYADAQHALADLPQ